MNPLSLLTPRRINTSRDSSTRKGRPEEVFGRWLSLLVTFALLLPGLARGAILHPPAPPQVTPVISEMYPSDQDGNRINDELERAIARPKGISITAEEARTFAGRMIPVQLVFNEPVTQGQIDGFLALGGKITYLFKAVSYGWNGRIPRGQVPLLPAVMGPALVQVEPVPSVTPYLDLSTQTGRVRPIWRPGFADDPCGFRGDPNTTIAFVDAGVEGTHPDLANRCVYWRDFSDDNEPSPVDYDGHGSMCAGIAVGTGQSAGSGNGGLAFVSVAPWYNSGHLVEPITLAPGISEVHSAAWFSGYTGALIHVCWKRGTLLEDFDWTGTTGGSLQESPVALHSYVLGQKDYLFSTVLFPGNAGALKDVVVSTYVEPYPGVGDGFRKLSGVAPDCRWAAAKIEPRAGVPDANWLNAALDDFIVHSQQARIKIVSISLGLVDDNDLPMESVPLRDQINTLVNNGIVVVAAAGNSAEEKAAVQRKMADPPRAGMAITVGAVDDENLLTSYSTPGFYDPCENEDCKPDILAPGGSMLYTGIMSIDCGYALANLGMRWPKGYRGGIGTSFAAPFVAGSAALVIEAMERQGVVWNFASSELPRYVKMLLCATASETNAKRETGSKAGQPTLQRATNGPNGFPSGKDPYEGYGILNPDAAVEAVCQSQDLASEASVSLGSKATDRRVWARTMHLTSGREIHVTLDNSPEADFDLYLYSMVPGRTGTPSILVSSTDAGAGIGESLRYFPTSDMAALLVVKRVSGAGTSTVHSVPGAPPVAQDIAVIAEIHTPTTVTLQALDDGSPIPPGALTYMIVSLPQHGQLEQIAGGAPISQIPATLPANQVVYRPEASWEGPDSFTFCADDGGTPPFAGSSNIATVHISVQREVTVEYRVSAGADDAFGVKYGTYQELSSSALSIGASTTGVRFRGVQVPPGAIIKSAKLSICSFTYGLTGPIEARLQAEAADNPADFSNRRVGAAPGTTASQAWNWDGTPWTANTWYESPDVRQVLQEVVNRPGWSRGNAVVILYSCSSYEDDRRFWAYDGAPDKAARLKITYQPK